MWRLPGPIRSTFGRHPAEGVLASFILLGIVYCTIYALHLGYLPPPFFYVPDDTFADWFNPAFWSRQAGAYDTWRTVYPPLTFVILRWVGIDRCYPISREFEGSAGLVARNCDWLGLAALALLFAAVIWYTWRTFRKIDPATAPMRTICTALGAPMLNGLERGNLILLAYLCLLLALGPLLRSARLRWFFVGMAINLKIYLLAAIVPLLLKRRWLWVEGAMIATVLVYCVSLAIFGQGTPMQIASNLGEFSKIEAVQILDPWSASTYDPLFSVIKTGTFPMSSIIGSVWVDRLLIILPALKLGTLSLIVAAAGVVWISPALYSRNRAVLLGIMAAMVGSEAGNYTLVFLFLFVMMEKWEGVGCKWAIFVCYILAIPADIPIDTLPEAATDIYFKATTVMKVNYVTLGPFVRPLLTMSICWAISFTTLRDYFLAGAAARLGRSGSGLVDSKVAV